MIKNIKRSYSQRIQHKRGNINNKLKNNNKINFLKFNLKDIDINLKNKEELEDEKEQNNKNYKFGESKESKERKNEQLGYIKKISQMGNIFPKNINQNNISLSSHKIIKKNYYHKK